MRTEGPIATIATQGMECEDYWGMPRPLCKDCIQPKCDRKGDIYGGECLRKMVRIPSVNTLCVIGCKKCGAWWNTTTNGFDCPDCTKKQSKPSKLEPLRCVCGKDISDGVWLKKDGVCRCPGCHYTAYPLDDPKRKTHQPAEDMVEERVSELVRFKWGLASNAAVRDLVAHVHRERARALRELASRAPECNRATLYRWANCEDAAAEGNS